MDSVPTQEEKDLGRLQKLLLYIGVSDLRSRVLIFTTLVAVLFLSVVSWSLMPPSDFPKDKVITIKNGATLVEVSTLLKSENIIRSQSFFEICSKLVGGEKPILAGQYLFKEPLSTCRVALRIARGVSGVPAIRVTIPEGTPNKDIATILEKNIPNFDTVVFLEHARLHEGFLFPDTYFFLESMTTQDIEQKMTENFEKKIAPFIASINATGHTARDIVIMASILEKEATTEVDKALVAGILWKRISIGMPLQVDASFLYLFGKKSSDVTVEDKQVKSTYNTYLNKGLPLGPIGNPGVVAIRSAIYPTTSPYLYYLSDNDSVMHYAKTFEEHKANKQKYLR
ncbi:MAG: endolytic transglycosylase MltG [Minisyncoccia bacterium]